MMGTKEIEHLKRNDPILGHYIDKIGVIERWSINPDIFAALILSIICQQISNKAARTVLTRVKKLVTEITPENINRYSDNELQACGMSFRKVSYIKNAAEAFANGHICEAELHTMSDQEVIKKLSSIHGVGVWTAEMLLINSLQRQDVVSYGDLIIRQSMQKIYSIDKICKKEFAAITAKYSPYGTVASFYLWSIADLP